MFLRMGIVHGSRSLDYEFFEGEDGCALVSQHNITSIALGAVHRTVVLEDVLGGVGRLVGEHAAVAAYNLHLQLARFNLAVFAIPEALQTRHQSV